MRTVHILIAIAATCSLATAEPVSGSSMSIPIPDADRGRTLFVNKGCVVCHAINGVGGQVGPALDASEPAGVFDPVDFAARMWRGAVAMIELQSFEFGYQVELTGQEIADLAAFSENHALQQDFSDADIPDVIRGWRIDDPDTLTPIGTE